ncbi:hypothetical protein GN956_G4109 [Arapaima gigas]
MMSCPAAAFQNQVSLILHGLVRAAVADIGRLFEARGCQEPTRAEGKERRSVGVQVGGDEDAEHTCVLVQEDPAVEDQAGVSRRERLPGEAPIVDVDADVKGDELKAECETAEWSRPVVKEENVEDELYVVDMQAGLPTYTWFAGGAAVEWRVWEAEPGRRPAAAVSQAHMCGDDWSGGYAELPGEATCDLPSPRNFVEVSSEQASEHTADAAAGEEPSAAAEPNLAARGEEGTDPSGAAPVLPHSSGTQPGSGTSNLLKLLKPCSVQLVNVWQPRASGQQGGQSHVPRDLQAHQGAHTGKRLCCYTPCGNGVWRANGSPSQQRSYQCRLCEKSFARRKLLRRHRRFHTGERPYSCPECPKTFALRKSLRRHRRFHTGEKPYSCTICGKGFRLKVNLSSHLHFHLGQQHLEPSKTPGDAHSRQPSDRVTSSVKKPGPRVLRWDSNPCLFSPKAKSQSQHPTPVTAPLHILFHIQPDQSPHSCLGNLVKLQKNLALSNIANYFRKPESVLPNPKRSRGWQ